MMVLNGGLQTDVRCAKPMQVGIYQQAYGASPNTYLRTGTPLTKNPLDKIRCESEIRHVCRNKFVSLQHSSSLSF